MQPRTPSPQPLAGLKIAATVPPQSWFGGVNWKFAGDMMRELREMGAALIEVDIGRLLQMGRPYVTSIIRELKRFRPDVAIGLENCGYAILCTDLEGRNIFRDVLEIPTIFLWDHGALQFCSLILDPLPDRPEQSTHGSIARMKALLDHPLFIHYSPDRGHAEAVRRLGIIENQEIRLFVQPAFSAYVRQGYAEPGSGPRLAFAGNLYLQRARALQHPENPTLAAIESGMLAAKRARPSASLWELLHERIEAAGEDARRELHLDPDSTFFWRFVRDEIKAVGVTRVRLDILTRLERECECFGNLIEPDMRGVLREEYGVRFDRMPDCVTELPALYQNVELFVDVVNPGYISGTTPKITSCFAAGGLMLFDRKDDFRQAVGDIAETAMYRDAAHLNAMIEDYLAHPHKRRAAARELQNVVRERFTFHRFARRLLVDEPAWRGARASSATADCIRS